MVILEPLTIKKLSRSKFIILGIVLINSGMIEITKKNCQKNTNIDIEAMGTLKPERRNFIPS